MVCRNLNLTHGMGLYRSPRTMSLISYFDIIWPFWPQRHMQTSLGHLALLWGSDPAVSTFYWTSRSPVAWCQIQQYRKLLCTPKLSARMLVHSSSPPTGPSRCQRKRMQMITRRRPRWVRADVCSTLMGGACRSLAWQRTNHQPTADLLATGCTICRWL